MKNQRKNNPRRQGTRRRPVSMIAVCFGIVLVLTAFGAAGAASSALGTAAPGQETSSAQIEAGLAAANFAEPLVAAGPTTPAEDEALLQAAGSYDQRRDPDDFSSLTGFLAAYPHSGWRVAVLANLGIDYLHYGYFSRAIDAWEAAWSAGKGAADRRARALVDRAIGELLRLHAGLGHQDRLAVLLEDVGERPLSGSATEMVQYARDTLWVMRTDPRHLYLCGPTALKMLMLAQHATLDQVRFLNQVRAGPKGTSLNEVAQLADQAKVPFEPVFRNPGEKVPVPSIVHWRVGHFAAIVGEADGRFYLRDPTFGNQGIWVTRAALDAEASGYFLAPTGEARASEWRMVDASEASEVWGAGPTTDDGGNPNCGMCGDGINEQKVSLHLSNSPVGYAPPKGPSAAVTLAYAQRDQNQPANFKFFNVSQKWTLNWLSYVQDDPSAPGFNVVKRYQRDGALYTYMGFDSGTHLFAPQEDDASVLELVTTSPVAYERFLKDGSIEVYTQSDGSMVYPRNVFLTQIIDPQGNTLTLNYGEISRRVRLLALTDATGRQTTFSYGSAISPLLITQITDPFGRSATLTYDSLGRLSSITDVLGLTSTFSYDAKSLIDALTTPYGATNFAYGGSGNRRFLNIVDPLGYGEREEAFQPAPVPFSEPVFDVPQGMVNLNNAALNYRDNFHWGKHQYAVGRCTPSGGCDYTAARITHFTHDANDFNLEWDTVESSKEPLEGRVWYNYPGQISVLGAAGSGTYDMPTAIGRVLDSGQTQLTQFAYNAAGNPTQFVDPVGRQTLLTYGANQVDLASVAQMTTAAGNSTIAAFTYNSQHRPLTYTDAAGQVTTYTYNAAGQRTSMTNPLGQVTKYDYNSTGDLTTIINANGKTAASLTYNSFDRVKTFTEFTRLDGQLCLRCGRPADRDDLPRWHNRRIHLRQARSGVAQRPSRPCVELFPRRRPPPDFAHRPARQQDAIRLLRGCHAEEPDRSQWPHDELGRRCPEPTDREALRRRHRDPLWLRIPTSRLKSVNDALGQVKTYQYALDNQLAGVSYQNSMNLTPNVAFAYDPIFARIVSMTDGAGTTNYSYVPVGSVGALQLRSEAGPEGTISYGYDALGRMTRRTVSGAAETFKYDALNRLIGHTDPLGQFALSYLGQTGQITSRTQTAAADYPAQTAWSYDGWPRSPTRTCGRSALRRRTRT